MVHHFITHHIITTFDICLLKSLFWFFQGGIYFFQLMDHYVVTTTIIYIALFEVIAVCWLYGTDRLCRISQHMTNRYPSLYFRFCWLVAAPLLIVVREYFLILLFQHCNWLYKQSLWREETVRRQRRWQLCYVNRSYLEVIYWDPVIKILSDSSPVQGPFRSEQIWVLMSFCKFTIVFVEVET